MLFRSGRPSYLSLFLGKRKKTLATLAYCNDYLVEQAFSKVAGNSVLGRPEQPFDLLTARSTEQNHALEPPTGRTKFLLANRRFAPEGLHGPLHSEAVQGPRVTGTPFRQSEPSLAQPTAEHRQAVHAKPSDELLVRLPETAVRPLSTLALEIGRAHV